jgi:hemolysin activation/secretion protein
MTFFRVGKVVVAAAAAVVLTSVAAYAAPAAGTVNPGRAGDRLAPQRELPNVGAPIAIPSSPDQKAPEGADAHRFTLNSVSFEGNAALSNDRLQALAKDYVGKEISLGQVYQLASQVTAAYRAEGFILARAIVPTQTISDGNLEIRVVEGFIDKVTIEGDAGGARSMLEEHGRKIAAIKPLTAKVLERELLLAQDVAGFRIRSVLTPSQTTPGAADLTLLVERDGFDAYVGVDNRGSRYLGPYEITGAVFANDIFGTAGQLGLTAVVTPDDEPEMAYGAITYDLPLTASGLRLYTLLSHTETRPGDVLATLNTEGSATTFESRLSYPLVRSRDANLIVGAGIASRDSKSEDDLVKPLFDDHVRSVNLGMQANALDEFGGYSTAALTFTQGLDVFGASTMSDPNRSRVNADGKFSRFNFEVTHSQPLISNVALQLAGTGQTSFGDSLLSSEQFGLGGYYYGRGYDSSEITGDRGLGGKAELQWNAIPQIGFITNVQFYGFYEGGTVWLEAPLPGEDERSSLASAGVGTRLAAWNSTNLNLEVAKPLTRDVAAEGNRDARVYFSLGTSF